MAYERGNRLTVTSAWLLAAKVMKASAKSATKISLIVRAALENNRLITGDER